MNDGDHRLTRGECRLITILYGISLILAYCTIGAAILTFCSGCEVPPGINWATSPPAGTREASPAELAAQRVALEAWEASTELPDVGRYCDVAFPLDIYVAEDAREAMGQCLRVPEPSMTHFSCFRRENRRVSYIVVHEGRHSPANTIIHETIHFLSDCTHRPYRQGLWSACIEAGYGEAACVHVDPVLWWCSSAGDAALPGCETSAEGYARSLLKLRGVTVADFTR